MVLSVLHIIRNTKYEIMEFLSAEGSVAGMMAAASSFIYGLNTLSLMYLLTFRWEDVVRSLCLLNMAGSMYLGQTIAQIQQVYTNDLFINFLNMST